MTRGNQRDKAREAAAKKAASHKQPNGKSGIELRRSQEEVASLMRDKQAEANRRKQAEEAHERQVNLEIAAAAKKAKAQAKADDEPAPVVTPAPDVTLDPTQDCGQTPAVDTLPLGVADIEAAYIDHNSAETVLGGADTAADPRKLTTLVLDSQGQATET